jgi:hypothetical protein
VDLEAEATSLEEKATPLEVKQPEEQTQLFTAVSPEKSNPEETVGPEEEQAERENHEEEEETLESPKIRPKNKPAKPPPLARSKILSLN